jgi:hypothetical protein
MIPQITMFHHRALITLARKVKVHRKSYRPLSSQKYGDPQDEAMQGMDKNMAKLSGLEGVSALPSSVRIANYATATGLLGFIGYIFWYSMTSVGQAKAGENDMSTLQQEASQARADKLRRQGQELSPEEVAALDLGVSDKDLEAGAIVAIAAPDDIATEEENRNQGAISSKDTEKRSLINRIIFFWK